MRDRKLTRKKALEEYFVYQLRLYQFLHLFEIMEQISSGKFLPEIPNIGHGPNQIFDTVRNAATGWFASLVDRQNSALNVIDVWLVLFPQEELRILDTWEQIRPTVEAVIAFRNNIAFHSNKSLSKYFCEYSKFREHKTSVGKAISDFFGLAKYLMERQPDLLPNFDQEIIPILKKAAPNADVNRLSEYFVLNSKTISMNDNV